MNSGTRIFWPEAIRECLGCVSAGDRVGCQERRGLVPTRHHLSGDVGGLRPENLAALNRQSPFFQRLDAESLSDQDKLAEAAEIFRKLLSGSNVSSLYSIVVWSGAAADAASFPKQYPNFSRT